MPFLLGSLGLRADGLVERNLALPLLTSRALGAALEGHRTVKIAALAGIPRCIVKNKSAVDGPIEIRADAADDNTVILRLATCPTLVRCIGRRAETQQEAKTTPKTHPAHLCCLSYKHLPHADMPSCTEARRVRRRHRGMAHISEVISAAQ